MQKVKPWRSEKYRRFVAGHPCCHCRRPESNAHHEVEPGQGTMGGKCCDSRCLPLCPACHFERHAKGRAVWEQWGIDTGTVIQAMKGEWVALGREIPFSTQ